MENYCMTVSYGRIKTGTLLYEFKIDVIIANYETINMQNEIIAKTLRYMSSKFLHDSIFCQIRKIVSNNIKKFNERKH